MAFRAGGHSAKAVLTASAFMIIVTPCSTI